MAIIPQDLRIKAEEHERTDPTFRADRFLDFCNHQSIIWQRWARTKPIEDLIAMRHQYGRIDHEAVRTYERAMHA